MKYLDLTFADGAQNLACDEALLEYFEQSAGAEELLRLWQPENYFVVIGHGAKWRDEVFTANCVADGVPVLRRCSGGGTVLQGPGCLNYSLILRQDNFAGGSVQAAFDFVLSRHRQCLETSLGKPVAIAGISDLVLGERKFSGNAQYRKRRYALIHGTLLLHFDLDSIAKYLTLPAKQPEYRQKRVHGDFVTNLNVAPAEISEALKLSWQADREFDDVPSARIAQLIDARYRLASWNEKF